MSTDQIGHVEEPFLVHSLDESDNFVLFDP